jgi:diguanylate cyclase (GGDEF)-like protein/PAS domain S-box-containing protein
MSPTVSDRPKMTLHSERWIGIALIFLGGTTDAGWLLHLPTLLENFPGLVPMVFNTGLLFLLTGCALLLSGRGGRAPLARTLLATVLVALSGATLLELALGRNLGVDLAALHAWYDYGNTQPGRMAPNTAFGFIVIGTAILMSDRVKRRGMAIATVSLTFLLLAIGLTGLVGYLLAPDLLFGWARSARMAIQTATGMILAASGLWLSWARSDWYRGDAYFREDGKIRLLSAAILMLVTVTASLTSFVLLQRSLESQIEGRLIAVTAARGPWLQAMATQVSKSVQAIVQEADTGAAVIDDTACLKYPQTRVAAVTARLLRVGYRGGVVLDREGHAIAHFGSYNAASPLLAALDASGERSIAWDGVFLLRIRHPIAAGTTACGAIAVDYPMSEAGPLLFDAATLGTSAEVTACVLRDARLSCLPDGFNSVPFSVSLRRAPARPLPMQLALSSAKGIVYAVDYRGRNVVAAFGSLAPGVGFVAKQDTAEAYAPIRRALAQGAPVIFIIALLGAAAMYSQLNPLVKRMRKSEAAAAGAASKTRIVMEATADGMITFDQHGRVESANRAAHDLFGYTPGSLNGRDVSSLVPEASLERYRRSLSRAAADTPASQLVGNRYVQIDGLRQDGSEFALEFTVNSVPLDQQTLFVGVMRDVSARKAIEQELSHLAQHDSLTDLPNRALFTDRLQTSLVRAIRSQKPIGLMFLDIDGFKAVNDEHGHDVGDELLKQAALRLTGAVRKSDTVARLGGDEFTIILEDLKQPQVDAEKVAAKIVEALRLPFSIGSLDLHVSASIGLVVHEATDASIGGAEMLRRADEAMYVVKRSGKNAFGLAVGGREG